MIINITGTNGFISKYLDKYLHNYPEFIINKLNLRNSKSIEKDLSSDVCVHLAGIAHDTKNNINKNLYYDVNTIITNNLFDNFLHSNCEVFIFISSVKSVVDKIDDVLDENEKPNPTTHYGKSKLLAEQYILNKTSSSNKRIYILRPTMVYGPGNKGNLNLLYNLVRKGYPWPLGKFKNKRSFCSVENLCFVIKEIIQNKDVPSRVYNVTDDST